MLQVIQGYVCVAQNSLDLTYGENVLLQTCLSCLDVTVSMIDSCKFICHMPCRRLNPPEQRSFTSVSIMNSDFLSWPRRYTFLSKDFIHKVFIITPPDQDQGGARNNHWHVFIIHQCPDQGGATLLSKDRWHSSYKLPWPRRYTLLRKVFCELLLFFCHVHCAERLL